MKLTKFRLVMVCLILLPILALFFEISRDAYIASIGPTVTPTNKPLADFDLDQYLREALSHDYLNSFRKDSTSFAGLPNLDDNWDSDFPQYLKDIPTPLKVRTMELSSLGKDDVNFVSGYMIAVLYTDPKDAKLAYFRLSRFVNGHYRTREDGYNNNIEQLEDSTDDGALIYRQCNLIFLFFTRIRPIYQGPSYFTSMAQNTAHTFSQDFVCR